MMDIEVCDLWFSYPGGIDALCGLSLTIHPGEQVAIVGQNGAGKSTLVKHFNGLLRPKQGEVRIGGWNTKEHTAAQLAARVGYVFQNPDQQLFSNTVYDEVAFGPHNLRFGKERKEELIEDALRLTMLKGQEKTNPYELSPTWRKLVALASILSMDTPVIIMDEPTTGQDAVNIERMSHILKTLRERGKTVITITHDIDFGVENFDRLVVLGQGQILLDGPIQQVISQEETLAITYVDPPQIARLSKGLGLSQLAYREEDFLNFYRQSRPVQKGNPGSY